MKRRYIIVICFACLIIFACLVSQFTVSQIQTDNALKYEEVNKISPLNISKRRLPFLKNLNFILILLMILLILPKLPQHQSAEKAHFWTVITLCRNSLKN